jgi:hypothetical protein
VRVAQAVEKHVAWALFASLARAHSTDWVKIEQVERSATDPNKIEATYEGDHTHAPPPPPAKGVLSGNKIAPADPKTTGRALHGASTAAAAKPAARRRSASTALVETEEEDESDVGTPDKRRNVRLLPPARPPTPPCRPRASVSTHLHHQDTVLSPL